MFYSWEQLQYITEGEWFGTFPENLSGIEGITDDTRNDLRNVLFIALRGENTDGHRFLNDAATKEARALCIASAEIERLAELPERAPPCLVVDDPLKALQALAGAHRQGFPQLTLSAITGSNGKTSTRAILGAILRQHWPEQTLETVKNTNNHIGVPRNLLRATADHHVGVIEIGTNHPGEIEPLATVTAPDIGIITNIGPAHLANFGSLEAIAREKARLLANVSKEGTAVLPTTCPGREYLLQAAAHCSRILTFGTKNSGSDVEVEYHGHRNGLYVFELISNTMQPCRREVAWGIRGEHQVLNAASSATAALAYGVSPDEIAEGLSNAELPHMRMEAVERAGVHWINDAYNANPESTIAGMNWFSEYTGEAFFRGSVLILGDMLELGAEEISQHRAVLEWAVTNMPESRIITVGERMKEATEEYSEVLHYLTTDDFLNKISAEELCGYCVYVKGSRSLGLERIIEELE